MSIYNYNQILIFAIFFILSGCSESVDENKTNDVASLTKNTAIESVLVKKENNITVVVNNKVNEVSENTEITIPKKKIEKEPVKIIRVDINKTIVKKKIKLKDTIVAENNSSDTVLKKEIIINFFVRDDINNIVTDNTTGLVWQDDSIIHKQWTSQENFDLAKYSDTSGDTAVSYCNELSLAGFDDWKLPSIENLRTIKKGNDTNETIVNVFKNIKLKSYWSSTQYPGFSKAAWYINFSNGFEFGYGKNIHLNVRCVRENI